MGVSEDVGVAATLARASPPGNALAEPSSEAEAESDGVDDGALSAGFEATFDSSAEVDSEGDSALDAGVLLPPSALPVKSN